MTGDAIRGESHDLRCLVSGVVHRYCVTVSWNTNLGLTNPAWDALAGTGGRGGSRTWPAATAASLQSITMAQVAGTRDPAAWIRHRVTEAARRPRAYALARQRVLEQRQRQPGPLAG